MSAMKATKQSKKPKAPAKHKPDNAYPAEQAKEIFHALLHEYDPMNHGYKGAVEYPSGHAAGYSLVFDTDHVSASFRGRRVDEVMVAFGPRCWVVYDYYEATALDELHCEALIPIEYDDPKFLEKLFRAISKLGVYVPPRFTASIRRAQQSLQSVVTV